MLDQRDLELLQKMMEFVVDSRMTESEQRMDSGMVGLEQKMDSGMAELEQKMDLMAEENYLGQDEKFSWLQIGLALINLVGIAVVVGRVLGLY